MSLATTLRRATAVGLFTAVGLAAAGTVLAQAPQILNVSPSSSPTHGGSTITIFGTNFGTTGGVVTIFPSDLAVSPPNWTANQIRVTIPPGNPGPTQVFVRPNAGGFSNVWLGFAYDTPTLTSLSPPSGPAAGGYPL